MAPTRPTDGPLRHVFVIGLDETSREHLEALPGAGERFRFHPLLDRRTVRGVDEFPVAEWLDCCRKELDAFDGTVDAIVSFWDFPVTEMAAVLCAERDLPSPSLRAVLANQHKYWSRLVHQRVAPGCTPAFAAFDPFDDRSVAALDLAYPFWVKSVRSFRSHLGFRVASADDLAGAVERIRRGIRRLSRPLAWFMDHVDAPGEVAGLGAEACIAEQCVSGRQCTLEGYAFDGRVHVYGVVDSVRAPNRSSFSYYLYPSRVPRRLQARMVEVTESVIAASGFDHGPFNVEFFWDPRGSNLWLLEVNCRCSRSHSGLFARVDGTSHLQVMVDLALGERPEPPSRQGEHRVAAKYFLRHWSDATVLSVPPPEEVAEVERRLGGTAVHLAVHPGDRLSALADQDSYSYELGHVDVGAADLTELNRKYQACLRALPIELSDEPIEPSDEQEHRT